MKYIITKKKKKIGPRGYQASFGPHLGPSIPQCFLETQFKKKKEKKEEKKTLLLPVFFVVQGSAVAFESDHTTPLCVTHWILCCLFLERLYSLIPFHLYSRFYFLIVYFVVTMGNYIRRGLANWSELVGPFIGSFVVWLVFNV